MSNDLRTLAERTELTKNYYETKVSKLKLKLDKLNNDLKNLDSQKEGILKNIQKNILNTSINSTRKSLEKNKYYLEHLEGSPKYHELAQEEIRYRKNEEKKNEKYRKNVTKEISKMDQKENIKKNNKKLYEVECTYKLRGSSNVYSTKSYMRFNELPLYANINNITTETLDFWASAIMSNQYTSVYYKNGYTPLQVRACDIEIINLITLQEVK